MHGCIYSAQDSFFPAEKVLGSLAPWGIPLPAERMSDVWGEIRLEETTALYSSNYFRRFPSFNKLAESRDKYTCQRYRNNNVRLSRQPRLLLLMPHHFIACSSTGVLHVNSGLLISCRTAANGFSQRKPVTFGTYRQSRSCRLAHH